MPVDIESETDGVEYRGLLPEIKRHGWWNGKVRKSIRLHIKY